MSPPRCQRRVWQIALVATVAFSILAEGRTIAQAQVQPVVQLPAKLTLRYRRARSGAPLPVVWTFEWAEKTPATGALEYEVYDEGTCLAQFRVPDFVLSPGKNEFNALLPAFFVGSSASLLTIHGRFVTGKRSLDFDEQTLRAPTSYVQWFSVGVAAGPKAPPPDSQMRFYDKIRIESFLSPDQAANQSATVGYELKSTEIPNDPLTFCNFDVFVLTPPALAELRADQASALLKWVRGGGSLCIVTGGGLEPRQADWLNEVTNEDAKREKFVVGPKGFLLPGEDATGTMLALTKGLGRVAVLREHLLTTIEPNDASWMTTARFLLKGHKDNDALHEAIRALFDPQNRVGGATAPRRTPRRASSARPSGNRWPAPRSSNLNAAPLGDLGSLFQLLMPTGVSAIPVKVIAIILAAYVLTIGPIDYFLLGALRLRRFTWILFPVVTVGFAGFTLWLSQRYPGSNYSRRAIEIYDFVRGGTVARRTRIEMLFLSQEKDLETPMENGLFAVVGRGNVMNGGPFLQVATKDTPETVGVDDRFPNKYGIVQQVPQWRPVLNRFFWLDPKPSTIYQPPDLPGAAGFDWDTPPEVTGRDHQPTLAERVRRAFGPKACAVVLHGSSKSYALNDLSELEHFRAKGPMYVESPVVQIVQELTQRLPEQLFEYVSTISPNGGPELDDLALSDPSDNNQSVLVIAVETESTLHLYRRAYAGSP